MVNKPALVILAAGLGSRFGGLKQLEPLGPGGESIMDYSVYDAVKAGFAKIIFVIRKDIEKDFERHIKKFQDIIDVQLTFQEVESIPGNFTISPSRIKPWGTGHALLIAVENIETPFAVINSDDFYGREAFKVMFEALVDNRPNSLYMIGYKLEDTISEFGTVSRGICETDKNNYLMSIEEKKRIKKLETDIISIEDNNENISLSPGSIVSMNFWGMSPDIKLILEKEFSNFLENNHKSISAEYYIPNLADYILKSGPAKIKVLRAKSNWFGITYQEDRQKVKKEMQELLIKGIYPEKLWGEK